MTASVTYPFLIRNFSGGSDFFPTSLAHLLSASVSWADLSTSLACFSVTNPSNQAAQVTLHVELTGYSTPYNQQITVPAMQTITPCRSPTPDLNGLYGLSAKVAGQVRATVTPQGSAAILDDVHNVSIETGQTAFNGKFTSTTTAIAVHRYQAAFSMPTSPQVQARLSTAAQWSRWGSFGVSGYNMHVSGGVPQPMQALTLSIPGSSHLVDRAYFATGESISISIPSVTCTTFCTSSTFDFYVMSAASYQQFAQAQCAGGATVLVNGAGSASGAQYNFTAPSAGWYYLVFQNNCTNTATRSVQFSRTGTQADTALDTVGAIYGYLKSLGITYVNVASGFFNPLASQTIRWPAASLTDNAANCVDGSMLFSSFIEALGLEPVVVYIPGHAFMGVRNSSASSLVWPVETTMLGTDTFNNAFATGLNEYINAYHLTDGGTVRTCDGTTLPPCNVDIKAARTAGVTPIPR